MKYARLFTADGTHLPRRFRKWDGRYRKEFYEVKLASGEVVECWPKAGRMYALDGSARKWTVADKIDVRLKLEEPE